MTIGTQTPVTRRRAGKARVLAVAAVVSLLAVAGFTWWASPDRGSRSRLVAAEPADLSTLDAPPTMVELTFNVRPDAAASHVSVRDADGMVVNAGELSADGDRLRQPVHMAGRGGYTVTFHATLDDGTELVGQTGFGVGAVAPPSRAPAAEAAAKGHVHVDPVGAVLVLVDTVTLAIALALLLRRPTPTAPPLTRIERRR